MIRSLVAASALLIAAGAARTADDKLPGPKIEWPDVKGLERQKPNAFKDAALGYSVAYLGDGVIVTIFVYDLGLEKIPTGPNSDTVKAEMYESALALEANKASGRYKRIEPIDEKVIPFGSNNAAPKLRRKRYEVEIAKEGPAVTELYVTGHRNHFLKIRTTYPAAAKQKSEKVIADLLDGLANGLK
jgi:hypothetical protein